MSLSVIDVLMGEHQLFRRLIGSLQKALRFDEDTARRESRDILLILLPALERHEEIEDLVFGRKGGPRRGTQRVISELNKEHWRIALLRSEILDAMTDADKFAGHEFKSKILELVFKLREHFELEEMKLWPRYRELAERSLDRSLARRARVQLQRLYREVERRGEILADVAEQKH